ncbi:MAG: OmpA family protein [Pseudomarimonas sp.]
MKSPIIVLLSVALLLAQARGFANAQETEDHPLLTRYEGSALIERTVEDFASYKLATAVNAKAEFNGETAQGRLTRLVYQNPAERSTLEIFSNYRSALERSGLQVRFTCALDDCGPSYARSSWNRYNGLFAASDGDPRYIVGRIDGKAGSAWVAVMVGKRRTQVDVLELTAMEEDKVIADPGALGEGLDRDGRVSVYGIYFDTDQAQIKPESTPTLEAIAALLQARPTLSLYVVGHTDMSGSLAHNRSLSEARGRAVVQALVQTHGIAAQRLEGHGVGPLAPVANNASEVGRSKNRRVELVVR